MRLEKIRLNEMGLGMENNKIVFATFYQNFFCMLSSSFQNCSHPFSMISRTDRSCGHQISQIFSFIHSINYIVYYI